jgi:cell shape-determining protein MreC
MEVVNKVIEVLQQLDDKDEEHELFEAYCKARNEFLDGLRQFVVGKMSLKRRNELYKAEKDAFREYLEHRAKVKGE